MTSRDDRSRLRDIEPLAPPSDADEVDSRPQMDEVAITAGAGPSGMPGVGVVVEPAPNPESLDPERDDAERNAAGGGWEGANEVIENDFEAEQVRKR